MEIKNQTIRKYW